MPEGSTLTPLPSTRPATPMLAETKKRKDFLGFIASLGASNSSLRSRGSVNAMGQAAASASQQQPAHDAQVNELQSQVALLTNQLNKVEQQLQAQMLQQGQQQEKQRQQVDMEGDDAPPAKLQNSTCLASRSIEKLAPGKLDQKLKLLEALLKRLEVRVDKNEIAEDSLVRTMQQLEARMASYEQTQNELGMEAGRAAGQIAGEAAGKAAGEVAGAAAVREAVIKVAKAAGEQAGKAVGLSAGKVASAGEYYPIVQRLATLESAAKRIPATSEESQLQAMLEDKDSAEGIVQRQEMMQTYVHLLDRLQQVEKALAGRDLSTEAMRAVAKVGLETRQDIEEMRAEVQNLRSSLSQATSRVPNDAKKPHSAGAVLEGVTDLSILTDEPSQSNSHFLEEALLLLGDNDSPEERVNAALASSQAVKTEVACLRQLLNGMNDGFMRRLQDIEDLLEQQQHVQEAADRPLGPSCSGTSSKLGSLSQRGQQGQGEREPGPALGPMQEEALFARVLAEVLAEVGPGLESAMHDAERASGAMEELEAVSSNVTKALKKADELSAGLMLVTTRLNERLTNMEKSLRAVAGKPKALENANAETVFNNLLPTRLSNGSERSSITQMRIQPRPLSHPAPGPRMRTESHAVQKERGPVTRTNSGGYTYKTQATVHNKSSSEHGVAPAQPHNKLLHSYDKARGGLNRSMRRSGNNVGTMPPVSDPEDLGSGVPLHQRSRSPPSPTLHTIVSGEPALDRRSTGSNMTSIGSGDSPSLPGAPAASMIQGRQGIGSGKMPVGASESLKNRIASLATEPKSTSTTGKMRML